MPGIEFADAAFQHIDAIAEAQGGGFISENGQPKAVRMGFVTDFLVQAI